MPIQELRAGLAVLAPDVEPAVVVDAHLATRHEPGVELEQHAVFAVSLDPGRTVGHDSRMQTAYDSCAAIRDDTGFLESDSTHGRGDSNFVVRNLGAIDHKKPCLDRNTFQAVMLHAAIGKVDRATAVDNDAFLGVVGNVDVDQSCPTYRCFKAGPLTRDPDVADCD